MKLNRKSIFKSFLVLFGIGISVILFCCRTHKGAYDGQAFETWNTSEVKNILDTEKFSELTQYMSDSLETTGIVILYEGKVAFQYGDIEEVSYIASCRKSVLSMLYGAHVANGTINLETTIGELGMDDNDGLLPIEKTATVNHLITSRSGVFHIPANGGYDEANIKQRGTKIPGEYFVYNNWDFNAAGYVLENRTGNSVYEEIEQQLAIPLGMQDWNLKNQKKKRSKKSRYPAYHMYFSTRDMAKIGQLMLNNGNWNGKQLIPEEWIRKITTPVTPLEIVNDRNGKDATSTHQFSYGYMWWLMEDFNGDNTLEGAYSATGYGGQFITVIPKLKLVIAHKSKLNVLELIGLQNGGVSDPQYWRLLERIVDGVRQP